jgi:Arc/MetJ-type ribon-helix-helix transcriptional regulator
MRQILNISLPEDMAEEIKKEAKNRHSTVSEFVRAAIRAYYTYRLVRIAKKGEKEYREGKTITLRSIRDLK